MALAQISFAMGLSPLTATPKKRIKVLVVEDNKLLAYIMQLTLEGDGYTVRTTPNGSEGYASFLDFKPDLIIADADMPDIDGLEMLRQIRKTDFKVKTILVTGEPEQDRASIERDCLKGVTILEKPFSRTDLLKEVSIRLGNSSNYKRFARL